MDRLPPIQRSILRLRLGLDGEEPKTQKEVAKFYDVTRERIRQIETKIKIKLEKLRVWEANSQYSQMTEKESCSNCRYSIKTKMHYSSNYHCRKQAPVSGNSPGFPEILGSDWCGSYEKVLINNKFGF